VASLGNNTVEVVDLHASQRVQTIRGLHEPQGILSVPLPNRIYVANGGDGKAYDFRGAHRSAPLHTIDFFGRRR